MAGRDVTKKDNSKKASNHAAEDMAKPNLWRKLWRFMWKLGFVLLVVTAAYSVYLDAQIKHAFSGNKWAVPAQIFARPLVMQKGQEITPKEVLDELNLLGYRKVARADNSGEFSYRPGVLTIQRRAFDFADGPEPLRQIVIKWEQGRIASIADLSSAQAVGEVRLEPWLVTRLVSENREDRMLVTLESVPELLPRALTLVEDRDFYTHHGVAPLAILRALMANIAAGRTVQGGSTLTQQLVKNMFLSRERSLVRKAKEALMAVIIDARYDKQTILQAYLNEVFLGQNGAMAVHGFGLASYFYFDRPANELSVPEIATLVAIIKGPSYYNPRRYPERVRARRDLVLRMLFEHNDISRDAYQQYVNQPLSVASGASLASGKHPSFMQQVRRELSEILADPSLRDSGVKVFTTLDIVAQRRAEQALASTLKGLQSDRKAELEGAIVVSESKSGEIRAIVGGKDFAFNGFNRALDARRQIGSLVKPAVYLTALEDPVTYNLATPIKDEPITLKSTAGKMWSPQNADKQFRGQVPMIEALTQSLNVPTVNLGMELGLDAIVDTIKNLGVESDFEAVPALTLGALSLTPFEVNQMYQTISNEGQYIPLHTVNAITTANNQLLWKKAEFFSQRIDAAATYLLNYALYKVTQQGTAKRLGQAFDGINMAGKTGTTDDYRDSWFSGFDRNNVITVWVGNDDNEPVNLTGAGGGLPVFINYQKSQAPKSLSRRFPRGLGIAHFDSKTGQLTAPGCAHTLSVPAVLDVLPQTPSSCQSSPTRKPPSQSKSWWERIFG